MFNEAEIEAIVLGARMVKALGDPALANAADDVFDKIRRVLPDKLAHSLDQTPLCGYHFRQHDDVPEHLGRLREALRRSRKVRLGYTDGKKDGTTRIVRPLGLSFVGHAWLLTAWCELHESFRNFRLDRVMSVTVTEQTFAPEIGKRFEDFLALMAREPGEPPVGK